LLHLGIPYNQLIPLVPLVIDEKPEKHPDYILYKITPSEDIPKPLIEIISAQGTFGWIAYLGSGMTLPVFSPAVSLLRYRDTHPDTNKQGLINYAVKNLRLANLCLIGISSLVLVLSMASSPFTELSLRRKQSVELVDSIEKTKNKSSKTWIIDAGSLKAKRIRESMFVSTGKHIVVSEINPVFHKVIPLYMVYRDNKDVRIMFKKDSGAVVLEDGNYVLII
ncbi:MAG: hypothetical protein GXO26_08820, partial [Crenarchaeota archaeon]|nr:hypothetical protein [Thermoproteota archaeon]